MQYSVQYLVLCEGGPVPTNADYTFAMLILPHTGATIGLARKYLHEHFVIFLFRNKLHFCIFLKRKQFVFDKLVEKKHYNEYFRC